MKSRPWTNAHPCPDESLRGDESNSPDVPPPASRDGHSPYPMMFGRSESLTAHQRAFQAR